MENQIINSEVSYEPFAPLTNHYIRVTLREFFKQNLVYGHKEDLSEIFALAVGSNAFDQLDAEARKRLSDCFMNLYNLIQDMGDVHEEINETAGIIK